MVITHSPHEPTVGVVSKGAQRPGRRTVLQSVQSLASVQVLRRNLYRDHTDLTKLILRDVNTRFGDSVFETASRIHRL